MLTKVVVGVAGQLQALVGRAYATGSRSKSEYGYYPSTKEDPTRPKRQRGDESYKPQAPARGRKPQSPGRASIPALALGACVILALALYASGSDRLLSLAK